MSTLRLWIVAHIAVFVLASLLNAQEQKIDTRVWSISYWQKLAGQGLVEVAPEVPVDPAVQTGRKTGIPGARFENTTDVPITGASNTTQSENSVFVHPLNVNIALNSNNSTDNPVATLFGADYWITGDGGATWNGSIQGAGGLNSGDPAAAIDLGSRYYVGYIANNFGQGVAHSTDGGVNWTHVQVADPFSPFDLLDKNHLWVDNQPSSPHEGNLYSAWTAFGGPNNNNIELSRSTSGGLSWSSPLNISAAVAAGSHNQGVNIQTGPNGEVYAAWSIYDSWPSDETAIGFAKSTDGGATFQPAARIISNIRGIRISETSKAHRVNSFPAMAVDISGGPRNGAIYIAWTNIGVPGINAGPDIDIYMIKSTDGGNSWSAPARVNQDPSGLGKQHYFPWATCDPATGALSIIFYDDRNVSASQAETWVANSADGGNNWFELQVSDVAFSPSAIPGLAGGYFGDYLGISARSGKVYPVWTDNRSGVALAYTSPYFLEEDSIPPAPVTDLAALDQASNSVTLTWTASGDDSIAGRASGYDIRYSSAGPINEGNFGQASAVPGPPFPAPAGSTETFTVAGLDFNTTYWFALKVLDEFGNASGVSNSPSATTLGVPDIAISPDSLSADLLTGETETQTLTISNVSAVTSTLDFFLPQFGGQASLRLKEATADRLSFQVLLREQKNAAPRPRERQSGKNRPLARGAANTYPLLNRILSTVTPENVVFYDDMESGINGWTTQLYGGAPDDLWHQTNLAFNSPVTSWWCGIEAQGTYATGNQINTAAVSPPIDLSVVAAPVTLEFFESYETEFGWDFCMVDVTTDGGASWIPLRGPYGQAPSGSSGGWLMTVLDLSAFAGEVIQIRFYFDTGDGAANDFPGWFFDDVMVTSAGFSFLSVSPAQGSVPNGQSIDLAVTFDAAGLFGGDYDAEIEILSNDPDESQLFVPAHLQVTGAPDISVSPAALDFGQVFITAFDTLALLVKNEGTDLLNVSNIVSDNPDYWVNITSFSLAPGQTQPVDVVFGPVNPGVSAGALTISSDDPDEPVVTVPLQGEGLIPPEIAVAPDSLGDSLLTGQTSTHTLTISNSGGSDLIFEILTQNISADAVQVAFSAPYRNDASSSRKFARPNHAAAPSRLVNSTAPHPREPVVALPFRESVSDSAILVIQDFFAWGVDMAAFIFDNFGVTPTVINSSQIAATDFSAFDVVITVGDQSFDYYSAISANVGKFEDFAASGGVVQYQLATQGDNVNIVNGVNVLHGNQENFNQVVLPDHPIVAGLPPVLEGNYANHCYLANLPPNASIITVTSLSAVPTTVEYPYGNGKVIATGMTWEFLYINGYNAGPMLYNAVAYSLSSIGAQWISTDPASGVIPAGSSMDVTVTFDAAGLNGGDYDALILVNSNDPTDPVVTVPAHLHVTGAPDIAVSPAALDFGPVFITASKTLPLLVSNEGTDLLTVSDIASDNPLFTVDPTNFSLDPGDEQIVQVTFTPVNPVVSAGTLTVSSDDPDEPTITVALQGEGLIAPEIGVAPDSLSDSLLSGQTSTHILTITNSGGSNLDFQINIESTAAASIKTRSYFKNPLSGPAFPTPGSTAIPGTRFSAGHFPHRPALSHSRVPAEALSSQGISILLLFEGSCSNVSEIQALLAAFPDVEAVDVWDANIVPSLNDLMAYEAVILGDNCSFVDPVGLGNVLADYVDAGGGLTVTIATFVGGWQIMGRLADEGYVPFNLGFVSGDGVLGSFDPTHPIMQGVQSAEGFLIVSDLTIAAGAEEIAAWNTGAPFVATKGTVAGVNIFVAETGFWSGDIPLILHNSALWSSGAAGFVSADPTSGSIPAGASLDITVTFDAAGVNGGDYNADIVISSNDPTDPEVRVPAHLHVTGAPDIAASPAALDFGQVFITASKTLPLLISNEGTDLLTVSSIVSDNPEFTVDVSNFNLDPGGEQIVQVTFTPVNPVASSGTLTITSNDPDEPVLTVAMQGQGVIPPDIGVTPASLADTLAAGATSTHTLTIANSGGSDLEWQISISQNTTLESVPNNLDMSGWSKSAQPAAGVRSGAAAAASRPVSKFGPPAKPRQAAPKVLLMASEDLIFLEDAEAQLIATGLFTDPDIDLLSHPVFITVADLMPYDAVLVWSNFNFADPQNIGNVLKEYVDAGGGVIISTYAYSTNWAIQGGILDGNYSPFIPAFEQSVSGAIDLANLPNPNHPIFDNINVAPTYWTNSNYSNPPLNTGATLLASDTDGNRVVAENPTGKVVGMVIFPSNLALGNAETALMFANALYYVHSPTAWITAEPASGTVPANGSADITVTFDAAGLEGGNYSANINIDSNDPDESRVIVPATLTVYELGAAIGAVICPAATPQGCSIAAEVKVDMNNVLPPDHLLGAFSATLTWDPALLTYTGNSGLLSGFIGAINDLNAGSGVIIFNGAKAAGEGGLVDLLDIYLDAVGPENSQATLDLEFSVLVSAYTFVDLLPNMTVNDRNVSITAPQVLGDVTGDTLVNSMDAMAVMTYDVLLPLPAPILDRINAGFGDVNADTLNNSTDALLIISYSVGLPVPYPVAQPFCPPAGFAPALTAFSPRPPGDAERVSASALPASGQMVAGQVVDVPVVVDMAASQEKLGCFTAILEWDPAVLQFAGYAGGSAAGFENPVVNDLEAQNGRLVFGNANPYGAGGLVNILNPKFKVAGKNGADSRLALRFKEAGAAGSFADLLPYLEIVAQDQPLAVQELPETFGVENFPNPFNPVAHIRYALPVPAKVKIEVFNILGQRVITLVNEHKPAGYHVVKFDAGQLASGMYYYRIEAGDPSAGSPQGQAGQRFQKVKKMLLVR